MLTRSRSRWKSPFELQECVLQSKHQLFAFVTLVGTILLHFKLYLANCEAQFAEFLSKLLMVRLKLLNVLHEQQQVPGKFIKLFEHGLCRPDLGENTTSFALEALNCGL